jgi:hypothetical protein
MSVSHRLPVADLGHRDAHLPARLPQADVRNGIHLSQLDHRLRPDPLAELVPSQVGNRKRDAALTLQRIRALKEMVGRDGIEPPTSGFSGLGWLGLSATNGRHWEGSRALAYPFDFGCCRWRPMVPDSSDTTLTHSIRMHFHPIIGSAPSGRHQVALWHHGGRTLLPRPPGLREPRSSGP